MTGPKTIPTDARAEDFIAAVEPAAKREDAKLLDKMFREATGCDPVMWGTSIIGYGTYTTTYASGREVCWMRAGFSPRKAKHSLYLMGGYCDDMSAKRREAQLLRLGKHSRGKSCLYINKLADVDLAVLAEMIADDWQTMKRIYPD